MKKAKVITAILVCAMFAGCGTAPASSPVDVSSTAISEPQIITDLKNYFKSNSDYTLNDIRVVEEEGGSYSVTIALGMEYSIDDFVPYVEQMIHISEDAATKFNVAFSRINPALYTGDNAWIGWSNDTLNFYNQDNYLVENVPLEMLKNETEKYKVENGYGDSTQESSPSSLAMSYNEMKFEIEQYLNKHNDTSKMYDSVTVGMNVDKLEFNITLQAYETYTFAAVTSAATDIVRTLVEDNEIEEYRLWVHSPSDAVHTISWISFNLDVGLIDDNGYNGRYNETIKLDSMLKHYGYEDYVGNLSDFLNNQNSTVS